MGETILELQNIAKHFGDTDVLNGISISIGKGEFITLLGPSGCGKTTTLRIIAGLETPDEGRVILNGQDVTDSEPNKRDVNTVFQNYALFPHMTVAANIGYSLKLKKRPKDEIKKAVDDALALVQLSGYGKRMPAELSGGQRQRVAIARAVVNRPSVLLLDEPLGALDLQLRRQMQLELKALQKQLGITFIYITHDQEEAMSISDQILVMRDGRLIQAGKPQEVYDSPNCLFVAKFLGTPPINVFRGRVLDKTLYIGEDAIWKTDLKDQEVFVGIRPEGFLSDPDGPFCCRLKGVEVMGRDVSILSFHPACEAAFVRSIIDSENQVDASRETVRFSLKPHKVFLFCKDTEERLPFSAERSSL